MATALALIVLGCFVAGFAAFVPDEQLGRPLWVFIYAAVAICALFCWTHKAAPKSPTAWLLWAAVSVPAAAFLFVLDGATGLILNPNQSFIDAMTSTGWFVLNLGVSPFGTFIALSGSLRSLLLGEPGATVDT